MLVMKYIKLMSLISLLLCASCSKPLKPSDDHLSFEEARAIFGGRGVQPGQPLPKLSLIDLDGKPASITDIQKNRPLVLVTASLTCNVARRQQKDVDDLRDRFGDKVAVVVIYTIDAHPSGGDPCPYTGKEWVPPDNAKDNVLVAQPKTMEERLTLARHYQQRFSHNATILVDTMNNASWTALGEAPNLGLLVDQKDIVREREGWFDANAMTKAISMLLGSMANPV